MINASFQWDRTQAMRQTGLSHVVHGPSPLRRDCEDIASNIHGLMNEAVAQYPDERMHPLSAPDLLLTVQLPHHVLHHLPCCFDEVSAQSRRRANFGDEQVGRKLDARLERSEPQTRMWWRSKVQWIDDAHPQPCLNQIADALRCGDFKPMDAQVCPLEWLIDQRAACVSQWKRYEGLASEIPWADDSPPCQAVIFVDDTNSVKGGQLFNTDAGSFAGMSSKANVANLGCDEIRNSRGRVMLGR